MLSRRTLSSCFTALLAIFIISCTEEVFVVKSAQTSFKIINEAHNIGKDSFFPPRLFNLGKVGEPQSADNVFAFSFSTFTGNLFTHFGADGRVIKDKLSPYNIENFTDFDNPVIDYLITVSGQNLFNFKTEYFTSRRYSNHQLYAASNNLFSVQIRFGPGKSQKAHRFDSYVYKDYVNVPFEVWDVTNDRQLMVSFGDLNTDGAYSTSILPIQFNGIIQDPYGDDIFIHDLPYDGSSPSTLVEAGVHQSLVYSLRPWTKEVISSIPESIINIDKIDEYLSIEGYSNGPVIYNNRTNEFWQLNRGNDQFGYPALFISIYDKDFRKRVGKTIAFESGGNIGDGGDFSITSVNNTSDGGALLVYVISNYFNNVASTHFQKLKSDLTFEFDVKIDGNYITNEYLQIFEDNGFYYLNSLQETFQINSSEVTFIPISFVTAGLYGDGRQGFGVLGNQFIALRDGKIYFFDRNQSVINQIDFLPAPLPSYNSNINIVTFYQSSNMDKLFFAGSERKTDCRIGGCVFFVGSLDLNNKITFEQFDFGSPVKEHRSYFNEDGSAAHVVLLQTSEKTTDLMFFQTDAEFKMKK